MIFWILAAIVLAVAAFISFLPLFRPRTSWTPIALLLVFLIPASVLVVYPYVGTPAALDQAAVSTQPRHASQSTDMEAMAAGLRARLTETPEHLEGWMLLSKTMKTMQRYPEAQEALETALRIAPEDPVVAVELVEARIFTSGRGKIDDAMVALLEQAVARDPGQQKGLWLLGVARTQSGEDAQAIEYWQMLLQQLEPGGTAGASVQEQIALAQQRLGTELEVNAGEEGISLHVSGSDELKANIPSSAVLFVIIRPAGPIVGPPLGVRRIARPTLPLDLTINDQDSMMEERKISSESEVLLLARLSLSGAPNAQSGDWQSAPVTVPLTSTQTVQLKLDQRVD